METDDRVRGEGEDHKGRDVDKTKSSMDMVALNNLVVSMRSLTRRVRLHVIHKLTKKMKLLKNKKGPAEKVEANQRKAERMLDELNRLKVISIDHASKFALANTEAFDDIAAKADAEKRVLTRMATHPLMEAKTKSWRDSHSDWQALAAFLLSKNTGRRFKAKPNFSDENLNVPSASNKLESLAKMPKSDTSIGDRLLMISDQKTKVRDGDGKVKVGDAIEASDSDRDDDGDNSDCDDGDDDEPAGGGHPDSGSAEESDFDDGVVNRDSDADGDSSDEEPPDDVASKRALLLGHTLRDDSPPEDTLDESAVEMSTSPKQVDGPRTIKSESKFKKTASDSPKSSLSSSPKSSKKLDSVQVERQSKMPQHQTADTEENESTSGPLTDVSLPKQPSTDVKRKSNKDLTFKSGKEMVIKKINLNNLDEELKAMANVGQEESEDSDEVPDVLKQSDTTDRRKKNPFFASEGSDGEEEAEVREPRLGYDRELDDEVDDDAERQRSRQALESTFIGQLSGHKRPSSGFRDRGQGQKRNWNKTSDRKFPQHSTNFRGKSFTHGDGRGDPKFRGGGRGRGQRGSFGGQVGPKSRSERRTERGLLWKQKQAQVGAREQRASWPVKHTPDQKSTSSWGKTETKVNASDKVPEKGLHPSWEASRKRKEQQTSILPFQGKKVKFDEDD